MRSAAVFSSMFAIFLAARGWAQQPSNALTLESVVDLYIQKNLELQSARYRVDRAKADLIGARLRPNPGVLITAENLAISGPTPFSRLYEVGASYTETVELGGKRAQRMRVGDAAVSLAEAQLTDTMRHGIAEVKRLYLEALRARYDVAVATENQQTFQQLLQVNLARFQEGRIPEGDVIKVRLERVKFDSAVKLAQLEFREATIHLLDRLGESSFPQQQDISGDLDTPLIGLTLETLRDTALRERADILVAQGELEFAQERLALERANAKSDLLPYIGYKRVGSDNTIIAGVAIPLKTRDHNQDGIARAESELKIAETRLQFVRNRALAEVQASYEAFQTAREQVQTFRNELLNQADESRSIALVAYQEGATALLPVLEAQRTRAEVRHQYFQTLFDYQVRLTDLELATGRDLRP